jgi:hypothetical protein
MVKTKNFIFLFLVSEALLMLILLIYMNTLFQSGRILMCMVAFFLLSLYLSIVNFILAILISYIRISKISILIAIIVFLCISFWLYYNKVYCENDLYAVFSKNSFIGRNMDEIMILVCLIINQLLVKFCFIIWR